MLIFHRIILSLLLTFCTVSTSFAQFEFVSQNNLESIGASHDSLIFNGDNWFVTQTFTRNTIIFDDMPETVLGNVLIPFFGQDVIDSRGIAYVPQDDLYYIADNTSGLIRELAFPADVEMPLTDDNTIVNVEFNLLNTFTTFASPFNSIAPVSGTTTGDLAYDQETDTLWSVNFDGRVDQRRRQDDPEGNFSQGDLVSSFLIDEFPADLGTPDGIDGMAFDPVNRTLFFVTSFPGSVLEYELDGTLVGTALDSEQTMAMPGGGVQVASGVAYDPAIGRLRVLIDVGIILTYDDPSRASALLGDINLDGTVNFLDISPFISLLSSGMFQAEGDVNGDGAVSFLDIAGFINILAG